MFTFTDENGLQVDLRFDSGPFAVEPKHVLALVQHEGKWLCVIHHRRGVEFPGGKQEQGETLVEAAVREVYEEANVLIEEVKWFAYYLVHDEVPFCKAVFTAKVKEIEPFIGDFETDGILWLSEQELWEQPHLSFYMRDAGMKKMLQEVKKDEHQW